MAIIASPSITPSGRILLLFVEHLTQLNFFVSSSSILDIILVHLNEKLGSNASPFLPLRFYRSDLTKMTYRYLSVLFLKLLYERMSCRCVVLGHSLQRDILLLRFILKDMHFAANCVTSDFDISTC